MNEALKQIKTQEKEFTAMADDILDLVPVQKGKLLDIGCGIGWVVKEANTRGFVASGIDTNPEYVSAGKKYLKVNLIHSSLENFKTKQKFDVVVLKHVLEHIIDPQDFLAKVKKLVAPKGYIMVSCPNIHSLMAMLFLERWYGLVPMEHRWHYTQNNLPQLLSKNGFNIKRVVISNMWYKVPGLKGVIFWVILRIADMLNAGDQITVVAQYEN